MSEISARVASTVNLDDLLLRFTIISFALHTYQIEVSVFRTCLASAVIIQNLNLEITDVLDTFGVIFIRPEIFSTGFATSIFKNNLKVSYAV